MSARPTQNFSNTQNFLFCFFFWWFTKEFFLTAESSVGGDDFVFSKKKKKQISLIFKLLFPEDIEKQNFVFEF